MIRVKLINNRKSGPELEVLLELSTSSVPPENSSLVVRYLAGDREFWVDGVLKSVYDQDGPNGLITLTEVHLAVSETLESRITYLARM